MYTYAGIDLTTYAGVAMTMPDVQETIKLKTQETILSIRAGLVLASEHIPFS